MWPFTDRRRDKRHSVNLEGSLRCSFAEGEETLNVKITELSLSGARLSLERLQIGRNHLILSNDDYRCELTVFLPERSLSSTIRLQWYNQDEDSRLFSIGVSFSELGDADRSALKEALKACCRAA